MRRIFLCAVLCMMLCQAVGCSDPVVTNAERDMLSDTMETLASETERSEQVASSAEETISAAATESEGVPDTEEIAAETADQVIVTVEADEETEEVPTEQQSVNAALSGQTVLTEISPDNVFVDYHFVSGYEGTYAPDECGDALGAAVLAFKQTEEYMNAASALRSGKPLIGSDTQKYNDPAIENEYVHDFYEEAEGGEYNPIFHCAYIDDFDNDGREEQFILLKFPYCVDYDSEATECTIWCRYYLIFSDADGNAELLDSFWQLSDVALLDYGTDKQLLFDNAVGISGADTHMPLYGVADGKAVCLYNIRGRYEKWECFLSTYGWQGTGDLMYFDTSAKEYRSITGILLDKDEVEAMDISGTLPYGPDDYMDVTLVGGKYYCFRLGVMDYGNVRAYEDGKFLPVEDKLIRTANYHDKAVLIDDIDKAIQEMIQPEQAAERMPVPFPYDDADFNANFYNMFKTRYHSVDAEIIEMVEQEAFYKWVNAVSGTLTSDPEMDINIYAVMTEFSLDAEDVCGRLEELNGFYREWYSEDDPVYETIIYTDEELSALRSGDKERICAVLASEYSIVIGDNVYSPEWIYYHNAEDYEARGITPEMLSEKAELYATLNFPEAPREAFERKLSEYCGEEIILQ